MCLLVVAWQVHPAYRLILAGNRDEFHERAAGSLGWWQDRPDVVGGRDLQAGGTWLAAARNGSLGVVTNFRDAERPAPDSPSRGHLVPAFLGAANSPLDFATSLAPAQTAYAGFNLLLATAGTLAYCSNRDSTTPRALEPGVYGLSNHRLDEPWPKLVRTRERFAAAISRDRPDAAELFAILADRTQTSDPGEPDLPADWRRAISAPFVVHERYGTRCTTVVLVDHGGRTVLHERRFDAAGAQTGVSRIEFVATPAPAPRSPRDETVVLDTSAE
jgi:uncharacterized protein with NRDE domain